MPVRRIGRRATMITLYGLTWGMLNVLAPVLLVAGGLHDLVRRNRGAGLRLLVLLWVFLLAELIGVALALVIGLRHAVSIGRDPDLYLDDNYRLQRWWGNLLLSAGRRILSLTFSIEGQDNVTPGPVVVLMRHTSIADTLLPVAFIGALGLRLRYVLKQELQLDPCLDIVGSRLPNYFVNRSGETAHEVAAIGQLACGLGPRDGVLLYPEGTRFTPNKLARARRKLAAQAPRLHRLSANYRHVLPPRPGGAQALLKQAIDQNVDIVFFAHAGLERFVHLRDLLSGATIGAHVHLRLWRIQAHNVPRVPDAQLCWLFAQWGEIDAFAADNAQRQRAIGDALNCR